MNDASKVKPNHIQRTAFIYIRQSTPAQVEYNRESTARQYALVEKASQLGWAKEQVTVIDEDLGVTGSGFAERSGFARLTAEVALGHVGIVFALEVSRVARNNADWYRLFDLCSITDTLVGDSDGLYHPALFNDRLVLGLNRPDSYNTSYSTSLGHQIVARSSWVTDARSRATVGDRRSAFRAGRERTTDNVCRL